MISLGKKKKFFFGKKLIKMIFLSCITNWCIEFFWFFTLGYSSMKAGNWINLFFQNSCFGVYGAESAQNGLKMRFLKFFGGWKDCMFLIFCRKIHHHKDLNLPQKCVCVCGCGCGCVCVCVCVWVCVCVKSLSFSEFLWTKSS